MGWVWVLIPLAALSIPIVAIIAGTVEKLAKLQERQTAPLTENFVREMLELKAQVERLEQRVAELEARPLPLAPQLTQFQEAADRLRR